MKVPTTNVIQRLTKQNQEQSKKCIKIVKTKPRVKLQAEKQVVKGNWMTDWTDNLNGGPYRKNDKN